MNSRSNLLIVDGCIYNYVPRGGIARYVGEVISRVSGRMQDARILLDARSAWGGHQPVGPSIVRTSLKHKVIHRLPAPLSRWSLSGKSMLYHSFNYNDRYCGLMPYMLTVYDMIYADYPHLLKHARPFVERQIRLIQGAKSIIAISRHTANRIIQHVPINPDRITVAHLGVSEVFRRYGELSDEMQSAVTKKTGNRPFFMYVGVRESYKNFGLLLTAYARLAKGHDVDLCVFGGAEVFSPHEVDFIVQHGLTRRIHLFPACSDLLLKSAYQMTLGLVFPSIDEGFGIPPLEAMVCGAPVLAAAIPPVKEVCGNAPLYFDPCSIEELFICLESALNPGIKKELEEKGYHQAASYTWDRCADTHVRVYGEVFARMSGSPGIKLY